MAQWSVLLLHGHQISELNLGIGTDHQTAAFHRFPQSIYKILGKSFYNIPNSSFTVILSSSVDMVEPVGNVFVPVCAGCLISGWCMTEVGVKEQADDGQQIRLQHSKTVSKNMRLCP